MQLFSPNYKRLITREVKVGNLSIGNGSSIKVQTMTTTDTLDTIATVEQSIRCIEAGAELIRITAPSLKEAQNLQEIKNELRKRGYETPIVADIHFTPNAAELAARIIEKVRVNPGNYIDKKKFEQLEYSDAEYQEEIDRIYERFSPLVKICKEHGTAMRIGTNHGSLSDRIMSRYGDTAHGMVESALEFLRVCRNESFHNIVLSMKSSNPQVMVQAYRLLVDRMQGEFGECYPLHLGVTEAGDGEDGRIKSAIGIGALLEDGIGDTVRVSLTEDPEFEIPVCKDLVSKYNKGIALTERAVHPSSINPSEYKRRVSNQVGMIGGKHVPVVFADFMHVEHLTRESLSGVGYNYDGATDKWNLKDTATDFIYTGKRRIPFALPGTLKVVLDYVEWQLVKEEKGYYPLFQYPQLIADVSVLDALESLEYTFVAIDTFVTKTNQVVAALQSKKNIVLCLYSSSEHAMACVRDFVFGLEALGYKGPLVLVAESSAKSIDAQLIDFSRNAGTLFLDGIGDGVWLMNEPGSLQNLQMKGRTYLPVTDNNQFLNNTSFSILQATRTRISKTEYISCPSCGRTLFDLQETTSRIRSVTNHLKGVKIAIMGCIVNGPGEMADADYGYVGSGLGKITLYKSKEVVKKGLSSDIAVQELIQLIKDNGDWTEPVN